MRLIFALLFAFSFCGQSAAESVVLHAHIKSGISPVVADYVHDLITSAQHRNAALILIELDTPGGLLESTRSIVQDILASPVPVVVYISPDGARAGSAGVFITLAAHVAAMAPSTNIGAAHPVGMFGGNIEGDMAKKVENDTAAWARSLAERQKRNSAWAEKAVRESASITANEALKQNIIEIIAESPSLLLERLHGRTILMPNGPVVLQTKNLPIVQIDMTTRQKLVNWLSNPDLLYLLMLVGFMLLFVEYQHPGLILPALLGVLSLSVVFGVQLLPINWFGVLLVLAALALFIAEIYVTSFGLLTIGGIALLVFGSYLLFDVSGSTLGVNPVLIWSFAIAFGIAMVGFGILILRANRQKPSSGIDAMPGEVVEVVEAIGKERSGRVRLQGSLWTASANADIEAGTQVKIIRVDGTHVFVQRI